MNIIEVRKIIQELKKEGNRLGVPKEDLAFHDGIRPLLNILSDERCSQERDMIYYELGLLYKSYCKSYNYISLKYAQLALNTRGIISMKSKLVIYIENIMHVHDYIIAKQKFKGISGSLQSQYRDIIAFYRGLLDYINYVPTFEEYFESIESELDIYQANPFKTFCLTTTSLEDSKTLKIYLLDDITVSNKIKYCICTSCDAIYFKKYAKYLIYSFLRHEKLRSGLLIIDLILNPQNYYLFDIVIQSIQEHTPSIRIVKKLVDASNIRAFSSTLRLVRAGKMVDNNVPSFVLDLDSVLKDNLDNLFESIREKDVCTRELPKAYPWQRYTCGFIFFNVSQNAREILSSIYKHLNYYMNLDIELWWIDQNAVEYGFRKFASDNDATLIKQNLIDLRDRYIFSPTGSESFKLKELAKVSCFDPLTYKCLSAL